MNSARAVSKTAIFLAFAALALAGCTTAQTGVDAIDPAFAAMPDTAPVPALKPDETDLAASSLAGEQIAQAEAEALPEETAEIAMVEEQPIQKAAFTSAFSGGGGARNCLMRAMYFESNRSSRDGQLAVGTVVMHRVAHGAWGRSVCGVVGAKRQFAPGVMSRRMLGDTRDLASLADSILRGKRHPRLSKNVMFFHQAGLRFPYKNMRYVLTAGGNTFYYKAARAKRRR